MSKKLITPIVVGVLLALAVSGAALAQKGTQVTPTPGERTLMPFHGRSLGMRMMPGLFGGQGRLGGGQQGWTVFDAVAKALGLTPTEFFEALHGGKTLADIAKDQNVDLSKVQDAQKAAGLDAAKKRIQQAVDAGKLTQAQADAMLKMMENGPMTGRSGMGGMRGLRGGLGGVLRNWMGPGFRGRQAPGSGSQVPDAGAGSDLTPSRGGIAYWE